MLRPRRNGVAHDVCQPRRGRQGALSISSAGGAYGETYGIGAGSVMTPGKFSYHAGLYQCGAFGTSGPWPTMTSSGAAASAASILASFAADSARIAASASARPLFSIAIRTVSLTPSRFNVTIWSA